MGRRGPKKVPTKILQARGSTLVKGRLEIEQPIPEAKPIRPRFLKGKAVTHWNWITKELDKIGLLALVDRDALARYCVYMAQWIECHEVIAEHGPTRKKMVNVDGQLVPSGYEDRPEVARMLKIEEKLLKVEGKFGLTPADRAGLMKTTKRPEGKKDNSVNRFFSQTG